MPKKRWLRGGVVGCLWICLGAFGANGQAAEERSARTNALAEVMQALRLRPTGPSTFTLGDLVLDKNSRELTIPARVNMREFTVEYALVAKSGKTHEAIFTTDARPRDIHVAALLLGAVPMPESVTNEIRNPPIIGTVDINVLWEDNGKSFRHKLSELITLREGASEKDFRTLPPVSWLYTGSAIGLDGTFLADAEGSIISLIRDSTALINNPDKSRDNDDLHSPTTQLLPAIGTEVRIIFTFKPASREKPPR